MIDNIIQVLKSLRATDRMVEAVRELYDCNTSTELEQFVAKNFKQDKTITLVATLRSTKRLNENIPSEAAAFLHFFKRNSDEAIASGYKREGSLMLQLHDKLLNFLEQAELINLANWILDEVQKRRKDSKRLSAFILSELDRMNDELFQAIGTVVEGKKKANSKDAKEIEDLAELLKVTFQEVQLQEMKKNAAYATLLAKRSARFDSINVQALKSLSPVESIGFLIGQRIKNNFRRFTPSFRELFSNLDDKLLIILRETPDMEYLKENNREIKRILKPIESLETSPAEILRIFDPINPILFATAISVSVVLHKDHLSILRNYISGTLAASDIDSKLLDLSDFEYSERKTILERELVYLNAIEEIGNFLLTAYGPFKKSWPTKWHVYWGGWLAVNPIYQLGGVYTKLGWRFSLEYGNRINSIVHNYREKYEHMLAGIDRNINSRLREKEKQDDGLKRLLDQRDLIGRQIERFEALYYWNPHEISAYCSQEFMKKQFLNSVKGR